MCGIAGIVETNAQNSKINDELLKKMSDVIIHRGPDSDGQWISDNRKCGFSFRRLAIIDLSPLGNQPMSSFDNRLQIVFNGEIYNHEELREDLKQKGYQYRSKSDTETILHGYQQYGPEFLQKMLGMWGLAIWDKEKNELFFSRDRIGIKPFYYYHNGNTFVFGSEIKSILQHPDVKREMNNDEMINYFNFGMSSNQSTLFNNIKKLTAGHYGILKSDGTLIIKEYWSPINENFAFTTMNEIDIQQHIMTMLRQSIKDRMMSEVPFGAFLSGGIDSSVNVALMAELMNRPVDTFTVGFKELEKYNELGYARKISKLFNTNHKEVLIDDKDAIEVLDKIAWHTDEPNGDPVCIPLYFLSKLTRDSGTIVIQVGEGSDEQYIGYNWMHREIKFYNSFWKMFNSTPKLLRNGVYNFVSPMLENFHQYQVLDYFRRGAKNEELYWSGLSRIYPSQQRLLFSNPTLMNLDTSSKYVSELHKQAIKKNPDIDYVQRMIYLELRQRLSEMLLMRVDKVGMAHSIEARVPFLDHRLVEFNMTIPFDKKVKENTTKYILKKAVENVIPNEIIYRKKQGFAAPVKEWFRGPWFKYAQDTILNSSLAKTGMFDLNHINTILHLHRNGQHKFTDQIYSLLMLSLWHKQYID